jgi:peptidoglycan endopeptidase LytE
MLEQKNKGRARVKIAVFVVLAIHGIGLLALLMQGCKKEPDISNQSAADQATNTTAPAFEQTNPPVADTSPPPHGTSNAVETPSVPTAAAQGDYTIAKGDTYSTIAKKFHVTVKAITDANPGVEPTKLKIGQTIHIPAPTLATGSSSNANGTTLAASNGTSQIYTVKSGDSLTKIASEFGVTVKAIRSANSLTTDKIVVGQKLKIPVKTAPTAPTESAPPATGTTSPPGQ